VTPDKTTTENNVEMINLTQLINRPYWNRKLVNRLLEEPDETKNRSNGTVLKKLYSVRRVCEAEASRIFISKKESDDTYKSQLQERADEIRAGLEKSIEIGLSQMKIPSSGSVQETFDACLMQMITYQDMLNVADMDAFLRVYSPHSDKGIITPHLSIYNKIAKSRPDLAFEAGRHFQMHYIGAGHHGI